MLSPKIEDRISVTVPMKKLYLKSAAVHNYIIIWQLIHIFLNKSIFKLKNQKVKYYWAI